jgi:hypothetical protein
MLTKQRPGYVKTIPKTSYYPAFDYSLQHLEDSYQHNFKPFVKRRDEDWVEKEPEEEETRPTPPEKPKKILYVI